MWPDAVLAHPPFTAICIRLSFLSHAVGVLKRLPGPPRGRGVKRRGGEGGRDKLAGARESAGQAKPKARSG